jgi:hypothetical protein
MPVYLRVLVEIDRAKLEREARQIERDLEDAGTSGGEGFSKGFGRGVQKSSPKIEQAMQRLERAQLKVSDASGKVAVEQERLNSLQSRGVSDSGRLAAASERIASARRAESTAIRQVHRSTEDYGRTLSALTPSLNQISSASSSAASGLVSVGQSVGALGRVAGPAAITAIGVGLVDLAGIAASASKSLLLLPAALTMAGAGFATLKLGLSGFSDAVSAIGDNKKFSEALLQLAPNAQQAAIAIHNLMPEFDNLRRATQDSLFAGVGNQIQQLTSTFLPSLQSMTTSIASSFNQMAHGVGDMLMAPQNAAAVEGIMTNIGQAFQNLAPAATSVAQAFLDITSVGAQFLPQIASGASDLASKFAAFIHEAAATGKLNEWLSQGLETVKELGRAAGIMVEAFLRLAPVGEKLLPDVVNLLSKTLAVLPTIAELAAPLGPAFGLWATALAPAVTLLNAAVSAVAFLSGNTEAIARGNLISGQINAAVAAAGGGGALPGADRTPEQRAINRTGRPDLPTTPQGVYSGAPWVLSTKPDTGGGSKPSKQERLDAIIAGLDPSTWKVDPFAGMPAIGPQQGPINQRSLLEAQHSVISQAHDLEESRKKRLALEKDNTATAQEVNDAKWQELEDGWKLQDAQQKLAETARGTAKNTKQGMNELTAALDPDLGISRGLAGLADNLVRFIGSVALAGPMAKANAIANASPSQGGYGLFGVMGAQGVFGPRFTGIDPNAASAGIPGATTYPGATYPGATYPGAASPAAYPGAYPGDASLLSHIPADGKYVWGGGDLTAGLADCSSSVEDLVNILDGAPTAGRGMSTANASTWLPAHGFLPTSTPVPGSFQVGFSPSHMQATLPQGTNFNWGSNASAAQGGVGGSGAWDPSFDQHYYRPVTTWSPAVAPGNAGGGAPQQPVYGGLAPPAVGGGGGGVGITPGGTLDSAIGAAAAGLDVLAPGAGQAAQTGIKLANRAVQYAGQAAGIGVSGLMETFLPTGGSELANSNWLTRIAGGIASAAPQLPNIAGGNPNDPNLQTAQQGGAAPGPQVTVNYQNNGAPEDRAGYDLSKNLEAMNYTGMTGAGGPPR